MKKKLTAREYAVVASMLFGLFFGAGNLIFPVSMGQQAGSGVILAAVGFCLTGVGLPLLGIASMGVSESKSLFDMSGRVGKGFAYFFTCALYLTIGPFFAIPRTATVSFQVGVAPMVPDGSKQLALCIFSAVFFAAVLFFSLRPSGILTWVGKILNPAFLIFMGVLIAFALINPMGDLSSVAPVGDYASNGFFTGFIEGYNTMDALASLAFGIILIDVIKKLGVTEPGRVSLCTVKSGVFSVLLMALIYVSLAVIGAQSANLIGVSTDGGTALYLIAHRYFGDVGGIFLGVTITFACLKTSIGLVTACGSAFSEMFPRVPYKVCAVVFSLFSFGVSNIGLNSIIEFSLPVLLFLYPLTMVLIALCLVGRAFRYDRSVFVCTMAATIAAAALGIASSLPENILSAVPPLAWLSSAAGALPFSDIGMGWIIPAAAGAVVGAVIALLRSRAKRSAA